LRLISLFSGSSGNCLLVEDGDVKLLIDAGVSATRIQKALHTVGVSFSEISAVLITHEHIDHVSGIEVLSRRHKLHFFSNQATYCAFSNRLQNSGYGPFSIFENLSPFFVGKLKITPFPSSHDAADPVGFRIADGDKSLSVITDLGEATQTIVDNLLGADSVFIESNHDVALLEAGPYPRFLKRRILGSLGHLSNSSAGSICAKLVESGTKRIMLGHLSHENNTAPIAFATVNEAIASLGYTRRKDFLLGVAPRSATSDALEVC